MNGLSCVKGEIHNVLAVLRITGRNNGSTFFDFGVTTTKREDNIEILRHKLLASFKELHLFLSLQSESVSLHEIDTSLFIRPFCDVILSDGIRGIDVMNITLTSLHKFLLYSLINENSLKSFEAINKVLIESIFNISFDDNSRSDKELIHIRIMEILLELLRCSAGYLLTNDNVCLCVQKCFEIRSFHRNYNKTNNCLMVRYTENVVIQMILLIFNKIQTVDSDTSQKAKEVTNPGFNIEAMARILKYLTVIINPNKMDSVPDIREFGLRLINVALETAGTHLNKHKALISIIQDDLCRQLLINSQSHNILILSLTLRVIFDLFNAVKDAIRVQLEVFFISIHLRIAESQSSTFEQKELILESIVEFCGEPDLIIGLYTNYDCHPMSTHLFEDLCNFLLNKATHTDNENNNLHLIAAEGILAIIDCIARKFVDRSKESMEEKKEEYSKIEQLQKRKRKLKLSARMFNTKLGKSFDYLQEINTLTTPLNALNVAQFLFNNPYLEKIKIGEFLGKKKEFNTKVLDAYVNLYDFKHMSPDEAMRVFLESFVLRGEAQQIERIIENFSTRLFNDSKASNPNSPLKSTDACFLLSYSMIQLNTDAHNKQIKNKMSFHNYMRNLQGVNDGEDFPVQFISKIYKSITKNEIKVRSGNLKEIFDDNNQSDYDEYEVYEYNPAENMDSPSKENDNYSVSSSGSSFFLDANSTNIVADVKKSEWINILKQSQKLQKFSTAAPSQHGAEMYNILWEPALSILQFHLRFARHPKVLDRVVQGIQTLARIAHCYQIRSAFNAIIHTLCNHLMLCLLQFATQNQLLPATFDSRVTSINDKTNASLSSLHSSQDINTGTETVSVPYFLSATPTNIDQLNDNEQDSDILAIDIRIIYTIKIFFELVKDYGGLLLTDGWSSVMKVILWLFHLDLIPLSIFEMEDFTDSEGVPLPSLSDPQNEDEMMNGNTNDSTVDVLTSWISTAFGSIFMPENVDINRVKNEEIINHEMDSVLLNNEEEKNGGTIESSEIMDPKCVNIINCVNECRIGSIFTESNTYHINSFIHFVRTLISLSSSNISNISNAAESEETKEESLNSLQSGSVTTHTITSLDPLPIQTSQLNHTKSNASQYSNMEDVICLPLTIDMKIFCLERLSQLLSANIGRINKVWSSITEHFQGLISLNNVNGNGNDEMLENIDLIRYSQYFFERITVNILKLCVELTEKNAELIGNVSHFFELFLNLKNEILFVVSRRIIAGLKLLLGIQNNNNELQCFKTEKDWEICMNLLKRFGTHKADKMCCLDAFHLIESIATQHLNEMNFKSLLNVLANYGKSRMSDSDSSNSPIHNTRCIEIILDIHSKLVLISSDNRIKFGQMWHKTLATICSFIKNKDYKTRNIAINSLHKALLQQNSFSNETHNHRLIEAKKLLFESDLFPVLLALARIENSGRSVEENINNSNKKKDDLRLKLLTLIFKVFLREITAFIEYNNKEFIDLWYKFLETIRDFVNLVQKSDEINGANNIITHTQESLKNVILVFQSNNFFQMLSNNTNTNVWNDTWNILTDIAPNLKQEFETDATDTTS